MSISLIASSTLVRISGLGTTFVIVEHRLDLLVKVADRLVVMSEGRKALEGSPKEVLFGGEAESYGVAVPSVAEVQRMLAADGRVKLDRLMSPSELALAVEGGP